MKYKVVFLVLLGAAVLGNAQFTVSFDVTNPDILVQAFKPNNLGADWQWQGTATFILRGTVRATGSITADFNGVFRSYSNVTGQPRVFGGFSAAGGDFLSTFQAVSQQRNSGYWIDTAQSIHALSAQGVTSATVEGTAVAVWGSGSSMGGLIAGGQVFEGSGNSVSVFACKEIWGKDPLSGAEFSGSLVGAGVQFFGSTEAGTYYQGKETHIYAVIAKQGLGFDLGAVGATPSGELWTTYARTVVLVAPDRITGETTTPLENPSYPNREGFPWPGIPGYILP